MGFLDHTTNNIIVDAVLTDAGRRKLASATGLTIIQYAFADPEVDYTLLKKYGEIVGKEKIEKNTPIYEASTSAEVVSVYEQNLLQDTTGSTVESISVGSETDDGSAIVSFPISLVGFDTGATLTLELVYTSTIWSLSVSGGAVVSTSPVGDPNGLLSVATISVNPGVQAITAEFNYSISSGSGERYGSFSLTEQGGASTSVQPYQLTN